MAIVSQLVHSAIRYRRELEARLELQQGIRAAVDDVTRNVRRAGMCLPKVGEFAPFIVNNQTRNGRDRDQLVIRTGVLDSDRCVQTTLRADVTMGDTRIPVEDTRGFQTGQSVMFIWPTGAFDSRSIEGVNHEAKELRIAVGAVRDMPAGSGAYAAESQMYYIRDSVLRVPIHLWKTSTHHNVGAEVPVPFARGIDELNVLVRIERNCPPCDVLERITARGDVAGARLVKQLEITIGGALPSELVRGTDYRLLDTFRVKPRNLLP